VKRAASILLVFFLLLAMSGCAEKSTASVSSPVQASYQQSAVETAQIGLPAVFGIYRNIVETNESTIRACEQKIRQLSAELSNSNQIASCDLDGDDLPELAFARMSGDGAAENSVRISIYKIIGQTPTQIYTRDFSMNGEGSSYALFQENGSDSLYLYESDAGQGSATRVACLSARSDGTLSESYELQCSELPAEDSETEEENYLENGVKITASQYAEKLLQLQNNISNVLFWDFLRNGDDFEAHLSTFPIFGMNYDTAIRYLQQQTQEGGATDTGYGIRMCDLTAVSSGDEFTLLNAAAKDTAGTSYEVGNVFSVLASAGNLGYANFDIGGKYSNLQFTLAVSSSNRDRTGRLQLRDEKGKVLYDSGELSRQSEPDNVNIGIRNVETLQWSASGNSADGLWLLIANPVLSE
jgi:hypothetical protein